MIAQLKAKKGVAFRLIGIMAASGIIYLAGFIQGAAKCGRIWLW